MINLVVFSFLAFVLLAVWIFRLRLKIAIPLLVLSTYLAIQPIPMIIGYPIHERYVQGQEGIVLGGWSNTLMVLFKDEKEPRLILVENREKAQEAIKRAKDRITFVEFGTFGAGDSAGSGSGSGLGDGADFRFLDEEQTMIQKDQSE